jgi:hypothetical protein
MTTRRRRAILIVLSVVALIGGGLAGFSYANFSAQTRNPGSVFSSGTLVLTNTKNTNSACLSTAGGATDTNVNNACDQLFNLTVKKPGDSATVQLTLKNDGSLNASSLALYTNACADSNAAGETYHGTGSLCGTLEFYIQAYTSNTFTTPSACVWGASSGSTCNFTDTAKTIGAFATAYTSGSPLDTGAFAAGAYKYYVLGIAFPSSAGNSFQGRTATFDFTQTLTQ